MDHCCYLKKFDSSYIILLLYVDVMLIVGSDMQKINKLKKQLSREIEMENVGATKKILGISITKGRVACILKPFEAKFRKVLENSP